jgi:hypothetical protein
MSETRCSEPQARVERLVVQELPDEVLVYDLDRHRAHSLNRAAALVWRQCDGRTSVTEMATTLQRELGVPLGEEAVWLALERLGKAHLLQERLALPASVPTASRRALMRTLAMGGGLALVTSIVAPEAHAAGTPCLAATGCFGTACCCICNCSNTINQNIGCQASPEDCLAACGSGGHCCVS